MARTNRHTFRGRALGVVRLAWLLVAAAACGQVPPTVPPRPEPPPRFWSWQQPIGPAADSTKIVTMVRHHCGRLTPEALADRVCDEILRRKLRRGDVAVLIQNFGMGGGNPDEPPSRSRAPALFEHWCDGVRHLPRHRRFPCEPIGETDDSAEWWMTPWMRHGIEESTAWMRRFIAQYKSRQRRNPNLPSPDRFHFDSERSVVPHRNNFGTITAFDAMRRDPRWSTEPMPGFSGRSLAELYEEAGVDHDPTKPWHDPVNRAWSVWYVGVCLQAASGAMNESAYRWIRAAWPACRSSNYLTASSTDGQGDPPRRIISRAGRQHAWYSQQHRAFADMQAPVLYWVHPAQIEANETDEHATMRRARGNIDALVHSFGGPHQNIAPWIEVTGNTRTRWKETKTVTPSLTRDLLAMLRGRGVHEFILWSSKSTQDSPAAWTDFRHVVDQVWSTNVQSMQIDRGIAPRDDTALVRTAWNDPLSIESAGTEDTGCETLCRITAGVDRFHRARTDRLTVVVESWASAPDVVTSVALRGRGGEAVEIDTWNARTTRSVRTIRVDAAGRHIADDGSVVVIVRQHGPIPFATNIDLVQVYPSDAR